MSLKSPVRALNPDFSLEGEYEGPVCGIDEVGRGPLAGPVVAACVYIPPEVRKLEWIAHIKDSKKLSEKRLEMLHEAITTHCAYGIAEIAPQEIDEINILQASLKAMNLAFNNMTSLRGAERRGNPEPQTPMYGLLPPAQGRSRNDDREWHALIDGNRVPSNLPCASTPIIKGDSKSKSIAAASIIAKVTRDRIMRKLAAEFPHYGWESNVGYPTQAHRVAIARHGITIHHRRSFGPVKLFLQDSA